MIRFLRTDAWRKEERAASANKMTEPRKEDDDIDRMRGILRNYDEEDQFRLMRRLLHAIKPVAEDRPAPRDNHCAWCKQRFERKSHNQRFCKPRCKARWDRHERMRGSLSEHELKAQKELKN